MQRIEGKMGVPKPVLHYCFRSILVLRNAVLEDADNQWGQALTRLLQHPMPKIIPGKFLRLQC